MFKEIASKCIIKVEDAVRALIMNRVLGRMRLKIAYLLHIDSSTCLGSYIKKTTLGEHHAKNESAKRARSSKNNA